MRGKVFLRVELRRKQRITPAYAGKSWLVAVPLPPVWDHPRICGEKSNVPPWERLVLGSPPHMRGKVHDLAFDALHDGITPAYAGKSGFCADLCRRHGDHPRICGEKSGGIGGISLEPGSPPHMRGKAHFNRRHRFSHGITPAYAGKSR